MRCSRFKIVKAVIVASILLATLNSCIRCDPVFVLETSDSSQTNEAEHTQPKSANINKALDDTNTQIITDDESKQQTSNNHNHKSIKQQDLAPNHQARRLAEDTQNTNAQIRNAPNNRQTLSQPINQPRTRSTTSSSVPKYEDRNADQSSSSVPKTEERLLISISSDDDDYKSVVKPIGGGSSGQSHGGSGYHDESSTSSSQKRKPSITISIQDANSNKMTSGSGQPAVIVRPNENGQGIVISTINSGISDNKYNQNNNNNNNNYKPSLSGNSNNYGGDQQSQREPHEGNHLTHTTSTTYRPSIIAGNDFNNRPISNPINPNRPLISTLLDPPSRPPLNDESPSRPSSYESSRPPRPNLQDDQDSEQSRPNSQYGSKYPLSERGCGVTQETRIVGGEEANPDDFLWMAAIIKSKPTSGEARPFCGGSLITRRHILTAAHCLENLAPRDVLVRLGSYDFDDATASSTSADYAIDQFRVPANYSKKTHVADIAIMRLKTPLTSSDGYKTVCMPQPRRSYVGALGTVTGYGSQSETFRRATPKLRQVTVPIWENRKCSVVYKKNLTDSFLCAGYEEGGKDACQGDSGGPLMTIGPDEKMMVVGVVSHGIGCGTPGYPGVYTRTTTFLEWIEKNTRE